MAVLFVWRDLKVIWLQGALVQTEYVCAVRVIERSMEMHSEDFDFLPKPLTRCLKHIRISVQASSHKEHFLDLAAVRMNGRGGMHFFDGQIRG